MMAPMLDLASIHRRFRAQPAHPPPADNAAGGRPGREAAVAVVLREAGGGTQMLFIQRAKRRGDPWSGHMAFPGGHREREDADLPAAAVRETWEEVGLDIAAAPMLGALPHQRPMGGRRRLVVAPFVFAICRDPAFALNREVVAAVWTPLAPMHRGDNVATARLPFGNARAGSGPRAYNGFRLEDGRFVWGLTYRMVQTFFEVIDPAYRRRPG